MQNISYIFNEIIVRETLANHTLEEAIVFIATALTNRDEIIKDLKKK